MQAYPMNILAGYRPIKITLSVIVAVIAVLGLLGSSVAGQMIKDDGLVQIVTATFLCLAVSLALLRVIGKTPPRVTWAESVYILCIYAMREMDFHRLFTDEHITRLKLYTRPYPIEQKLIGGVIMVLFIIIALHFVATNARGFFASLKAKTPRAMHLVTWAGLLVGAQIIDKPHLFKGYLKTLTEETMELGAAMMMLFIMLSFHFDAKKPLRRNKE